MTEKRSEASQLDSEKLLAAMLNRHELPEWPPIRPLSEEEELEPTTTSEELEEESKAALARKIENIMGKTPPKQETD